jgi:hypothetical protein
MKTRATLKARAIEFEHTSEPLAANNSPIQINDLGQFGSDFWGSHSL